MRLLLAACALLAFSQLVQASQEAQSLSLPKWIKPENKAWPHWGTIHLKWLKRERAEAQRDATDAAREVSIVRRWARTYVSHRLGEISLRIRNRGQECSSFTGLVSIRRGNFLFHHGIHQRLSKVGHWDERGDAIRQRLIRKYGPQKGARMYRKRYKNKYLKWIAQREQHYRQKFNSKFSEHARMLVVSQDRFNAAKRAFNNCRVSVARLAKRKVDIKKIALATAKAAIVRAQQHLARTQARVKRINDKIVKLFKAIQLRWKNSKIHYFHRCRRVGAYKYKCFFSIVHGGPAFARQPHRFFKCIWSGATKAVVRYVCYK